MKKVFLMLVACLMITLASCGSADYDAIADKIEKEQTLSSSDYSAMFDYLEQAIENAPKSGDPAEEMQWMEKDYPHFMMFGMAIGIADYKGELDSDLKERMEKLQDKLTEFK